LLDELANVGRENLDAEHVARYDRKMDSRADEEVDVIRGFGIGGSSVVVDLGCGTRQFTIDAATGRHLPATGRRVLLRRRRRLWASFGIRPVRYVARTSH
jgi:hypothetical protein